MMVGFQGTHISRSLRGFLEDVKPAGIILFKRNVENREGLTRLIHELNFILSDPLIAIDEEGGDVSRIDFITPIISHMGLGATGDPKVAYKAASIIGRELRLLGINIDLAPVLDVNVNPENPIIGSRSFGEDPEKVAIFGENFIKGLLDSGVIPVAKHFPGHGDTSVDSHYDLPVIPHSYERLLRVEVFPFIKAVKAGCPMIMVGHLAVPAIDEGLKPASLSEKVINGFLRGFLSFNGVVITDDLEMKAVAERYDIAQASVKALESGADLVLICHTRRLQEEAYNAIDNALKDSNFYKKAIIKKKRIAELKSKIKSFKPEYKMVDTKLAYHESLEIAKKSITVVKWERLKQLSCKRCLILYPMEIKGKMSYFIERLHNVRKTLEIIVFPIDDGKIKSKDLVEKLFTTETLCIIFTKKAERSVAQKEVIMWLGKRENAVFVSVNTPYDIRVNPNIKNFVAIYSTSRVTLDALLKLLTEDIEALGTLPVTISGVAERGYGIKTSIKVF